MAKGRKLSQKISTENGTRSITLYLFVCDGPSDREADAEPASQGWY